MCVQDAEYRASGVYHAERCCFVLLFVAFIILHVEEKRFILLFRFNIMCDLIRDLRSKILCDYCIAFSIQKKEEKSKENKLFLVICFFSNLKIN